MSLQVKNGLVLVRDLIWKEDMYQKTLDGFQVESCAFVLLISNARNQKTLLLIKLKFIRGINLFDHQAHFDAIFPKASVEIKKTSRTKEGFKFIDLKRMKVVDIIGFGELGNVARTACTQIPAEGIAEFFFTIPQYSADLHLLATQIDNYFSDCNVKTLGQMGIRELHKDNNPHLHGLVKTNSTMRIDIEDFTDSILKPLCHTQTENIWPNIQIAKSEKAVLRYIQKTLNPETKSMGLHELKEFTNHFANGVYATGNTTKDFTSYAIDAIIKRKKTIKELVNEEKTDAHMKEMMRNLRNLELVSKYVSVRPKKRIFVMPKEPTEPKAFVIGTGLNEYIKGTLMNNYTLPHHLFITGGSGTGKTEFAKYLKMSYRTYLIDNSAGFNSNGEDSVELIVYDEFVPSTLKRIGDLNAFIRGVENSTFECKGSHFEKNKNVPCLFISNYSYSEIYSKFANPEFSAFEKRFRWIDLGNTVLPNDFKAFFYTTKHDVSTQVDNSLIISHVDADLTICIENDIAFCSLDRGSSICKFDTTEHSVRLLTEDNYFYLNNNEVGTDFKQDFKSQICSFGIPESCFYVIENHTVDYPISMSSIVKEGDIVLNGVIEIPVAISSVGRRRLTLTEDCCLDYRSLVSNKHYKNASFGECFCMDQKEDLVFLSCSHTVHLSCLENGFTQGLKNCPVCRKYLSNHFYFA